MNQKKKKSSGMGIISILTLIFIILKLIGYIEWNWVWIFSPIWISAILFMAATLIILVGGRIKKGKW